MKIKFLFIVNCISFFLINFGASRDVAITLISGDVFKKEGITVIPVSACEATLFRKAMTIGDIAAQLSENLKGKSLEKVRNTPYFYYGDKVYGFTYLNPFDNQNPEQSHTELENCCDRAIMSLFDSTFTNIFILPMGIEENLNYPSEVVATTILKKLKEKIKAESLKKNIMLILDPRDFHYQTMKEIYLKKAEELGIILCNKCEE